ncbi:hypothetical protein BO83DRAFT_324057 [Aspergillus eucalypticola CBS 122712]|uniref:Uncharacterized protein n=1 Tax=Aspergillus eucalypticola (strain CBS 122712 / IBT 29274) TaxID=1448314 RepID=A0A317USE7_ASPEC|nr:uncharacterized protein BO83DRAFT_324057 [Aspergillus eucalypticola CBS 122712]PWY63497.1 hypothetical protein BO83DRAFT_324057 [Aspergillus eucalypticola CBS 122712]
MSTQQSSQPRAIQTPSLARDSHGNDAEGDRRSISEESDLSHYLHYEDNDGFFPPAWLGKAPPTQHDVTKHHVRRIRSSFLGLSRHREGRNRYSHGTVAISRGDYRGAC